MKITTTGTHSSSRIKKGTFLKNVKLSMCLIKDYVMKADGGVDV
jgi:hypothetical protein